MSASVLSSLAHEGTGSVAIRATRDCAVSPMTILTILFYSIRYVANCRTVTVLGNTNPKHNIIWSNWPQRNWDKNTQFILCAFHK